MMSIFPKKICSVSLQNGFAQKMFKWAKVGTKVVVEGRGQEYVDAVKFAKEYYGDTYAIVNAED